MKRPYDAMKYNIISGYIILEINIIIWNDIMIYYGEI